MLARLRREIVANIMPLCMSIDELKRYSGFAASVKSPYVKKLEELRLLPELSDCYDCIDYMIKNMVRLEQEAMLTDM